jgi:hypothetical protein
MTNNGIVTIHGKDYMTVARRIELAHDDNMLESVETEVLSHDPVVIRAKVLIKGKVYTGISSVNLDNARIIEKENPYEVAETSAVGRALGFAGYGILESIATADEMVRATSLKTDEVATAKCEICGEPATEKTGLTKGGKPYHGVFFTKDKSLVAWLKVDQKKVQPVQAAN